MKSTSSRVFVSLMLVAASLFSGCGGSSSTPLRISVPHLGQRGKYFRTVWRLWDARYWVTIQRTWIAPPRSLLDRQEWEFLAFRWRRSGFHRGVWPPQ